MANMTENANNTNTVKAFTQRFGTEIQNFLKNNASQEVYESVFSDGIIDSQDVEYLRNYASSNTDKGSSKDIDNAINKMTNFLALQDLIHESKPQNSENISEDDNGNTGDDTIKQAASALNMGIDKFNEMASSLGFSAEEFATSVLDEISKQSEQNQEPSDKTDTQASATENSSNDSSSLSGSSDSSSAGKTGGAKNYNNSPGGSYNTGDSIETSTGNTNPNNNAGETKGFDKNASVDDLKSRRKDVIKPNVEKAENDVKTAKENSTKEIKEKEGTLKEKKTAFDEAQEAYEEAIKEDDYLNSEEGSKLKKDIEDNLKEIAEVEEQEMEATQKVSTSEDELIAAKENTIKKQAELTTAQKEYNIAENRLNSLKQIREKIKNQVTNDSGSDNLDKIQDEIIEAEKTLKEKEEARKKAENNLKAAEKEEEAAEKNLKTAKKELDTKKTELEKLNNTKNELDEQVDANCMQATKDAKEIYTKAKNELDAAQKEMSDTVTNTKDALNTAEDTLKISKAELNEIDALIEEKEDNKDFSENKTKEYKVSSPDEIELSSLSAFINEETAEKLRETAANNIRNTVDACLGGVDDQFQRVFGIRSGRMGAYELGDILASNEGLGKYFGEVKNVSREELASLPGGCVVVWDNNANGGGSNVSSMGRKYGHISICLGDGRESSDHIQQQITNRDATYRVFYPKNLADT